MNDKNKKSSEYHRGHEIVKDIRYKYKDTGELVRENKYRDCGHCGRPNTPEGHDGCLGELPGVINACCGHGKDKGYIQFENGVIVRGWFTVENSK